MDEDEILSGILKRDPSALDAAMNAYMAPAYSLCAAILAGVGTSEDIEECTSDTFYVVWISVEKYDRQRAAFRTWVLMIAKYTALERRRSLTDKAHQSKIPLNAEIIVSKADESFSTIEGRERLQAALKTLPEVERELIYKRYFLDVRVADLAREYGLSRQAVDNRLWRARKSLKFALSAGAEREAVE